jgi:hypothetical protein
MVDPRRSRGTLMRGRWLLIGASVAVVAAALVGGQLVMNASKPTPAAPDGVASDGASSSVVSTPAAGNDATRTSLPPLPRSQAGLKPAVPTGPAEAGEPLPPLSASPPGLITGFQEGLVPAGSAYGVKLRPWGMGPDDAAGRTAVVTIYSIAPSGGAPDRFASLKNHTILVVMNAKAGGTLERGGVYSAALTFVAVGTRLVPTISGAHLTTP